MSSEIKRARDYHDRGFPPRTEAAGPFLRRALIEHRGTHQEWCDHYSAKGDSYEAAYQQRAVERYDEMLSALDELVARISQLVGRDVVPPRVGPGWKAQP